MAKRGRPCTICQHPQREEIDKLLAPSDANFAAISRDFAGISEDALKRHKESHIPEELLKSTNIQEIANADSLKQQLKDIREKAYSLLDKAEAAGNTKAYGPPSAYLKEIREQIKLMAELEGRLASQPQITIINHPEWVELRTLIVTALDPYPQAKQAVIDALP
jgi:hypothetical protein